MRPHRPFTRYGAAEAPISDLNTTPLIDVMLVLLIMFIITIPIQTHKVPLDLPQREGPRTEDPVVHRLAIDAGGGLVWDGRAIARAELRPRLEAMQAGTPSELHFSAAATTRYEDFDEVLAIIKHAGVTRMGMVGNERFAKSMD